MRHVQHASSGSERQDVVQNIACLTSRSITRPRLTYRAQHPTQTPLLDSGLAMSELGSPRHASANTRQTR